MIFALMPIIFLVGIILVALEDVVRINKTAIVLAMAIILWGLFLLDADAILAHNAVLSLFSEDLPNFENLTMHERITEFMEMSLIHALGDVSSTLFFVMGSMALIEIIDVHGAFSMISRWINLKTKRQLLWFIAFLTFILSAIIGNLATVIVTITIVSKILTKRPDRLIFACMIVVASNAGGCWSPIGDVTTLLLWTSGNLGMVQQVTHLIVPALFMLIIPLIGATFMLKNGPIRTDEVDDSNRLGQLVSEGFQTTLLIITTLAFISVPVLQTWIALPPFMGVLLGLAVIWFITDLRYSREQSALFQRLRVGHAFTRIDISTVLYFLGVLLSVDALKTAGQLDMLANTFNNLLPNPESIALMLGVCSSFLDNVALVAAAIGMYAVQPSGPFMVDGVFWTFLAYCGVTGGSLLIIGSASGITAMGLEKIPFTYYLKKFTPWILLGYFVGAVVFLLFFA
ncbi:MAG: sodium:proton antiporter NhaD [Bacteroidales bacterium]|nr:sodium:proton antiporter NhaD [Bacteroidales bacterium]